MIKWLKKVIVVKQVDAFDWKVTRKSVLSYIKYNKIFQPETKQKYLGRFGAFGSVWFQK